MVAPRKIGEPIRSFVRVPGEGRAAKALCWDLSRSSSMVAAVAPLQLPLPSPSVPLAQDPPQSSTPGPKLDPAAPSHLLPKNKQQLLQPVPQQGIAGTPKEGKRLREEEEQQRLEEGARKPKVARTTADTGGMQQPISDPAQPQPDSREEVQLLRQQCIKLQQQNQHLEWRLAQIHSLLRDKQRLSSFIRQMDVLVK